MIGGGQASGSPPIHSTSGFMDDWFNENVFYVILKIENFTMKIWTLHDNQQQHTTTIPLLIDSFLRRPLLLIS